MIESPVMLEADLQPGDVIFFTNIYKDPKDPSIDVQSYIDHVGMFAGYDERNNPLIVHSITGSKGHYHPEKASGLCVTTLRALRNQIQEDDGRIYDVSYSVFRSKYTEITPKALAVIKQQAAYRIPYDEKRLDEKLKREAEYEGEDFMRLGMNAYPKSGLFRSIKYAARFPHPLTRTRGTGVGRGLTCSMAVILAFQIAELYLDDKIIHANVFLNEWPSDKYGLSTSTHPFHDEKYSTYLDQLRKETSARTEQNGLKLGIDFWKGDVPPQSYQHKTFPLDSKIVGAEGMYYYMKNNGEAWEFLGGLKVAERRFSIDDKTMHKQKLIESYQAFINAIQNEVVNFPITCSPAPSPTPAPQGDNSSLWWNTVDISSRIKGVNIMSEKEFDAFNNPNMREILILKANELIQSCSTKDMSVIMGLLLNSSFINYIIINQGSLDTTPSFCSDKATCYQEIPLLVKKNVNINSAQKRTTMFFYPNREELVQHSYFIYLQILFNEFVKHIKTVPDIQKRQLIFDLIALGRTFITRDKYFDAFSMYHVSQLLYCLLDESVTLMHEQMLQIFLLKIQALKLIAKNDPVQTKSMNLLIKNEKLRATELLLFLKGIIAPQHYKTFVAYPVCKKIFEFNASETRIKQGASLSDLALN